MDFICVLSPSQEVGTWYPQHCAVGSDEFQNGGGHDQHIVEKGDDTHSAESP